MFPYSFPVLWLPPSCLSLELSQQCQIPYRECGVSSQVGSTENVVKKAHLGSVTGEEQAEGPCCEHRLWVGGWLLRKAKTVSYSSLLPYFDLQT